MDVDGDVAFLFERLRRLGDQVGSILFQLPPSLRFDLGLLESFLATLRPGGQAVLEFRHSSWRNETVYRLLETHRVALCVAETDEETQPADVVGPVSYLRLHKSRYADEDLHRWAQWIGQRTGEGRSVFAYFTHEEGAPATEYARTLLGLVASSSQ